MKKRFVFLIFFLFLAVLISFVSAKDAYVDQNSVNGPCNDSYSRAQNDFTHPWCTINASNSKHLGGDTVYILPGEYRGAIAPKQGSAGAYTVYSGYGNREQVKILGSNIVGGWSQYSGNIYVASYKGHEDTSWCYDTSDTMTCWQNSTLFLTNARNLASLDAPGEFYYDPVADQVYVWTTTGIPSNHLIECSARMPAPTIGSYTTLTNLSIWHSCRNGMMVGDKTHHINIINNDIGFHTGKADENSAAIFHLQDASQTLWPNVNIINNKIHDQATWEQGYPDGSGIKFYTIKDSVIRGNEIYNIVRPIHIKQYNDNISIIGNIVHDSRDGIVFGFGSNNCSVSGNIFYNNYYAIIGEPSSYIPSTYTSVQENTFYNNNYSIHYGGSNAYMYYATGKNNLFYNTNNREISINYQFTVDTSDFDYNLFYRGIGNPLFESPGIENIPLAQWRTNTNFDLNSIVTNPLFLSTDPSSPDFLRPAPGSPACTLADGGGYVGAVPCAGQAPTCYDVNNDNKINIKDLALVIYNQGQLITNREHLDVNGNGVINFDDVKLVIGGMGGSC